MSGFIDTHAHLAMLEHSPLQEVLARAKTASINKMVSVSVDEMSWEANRKLAETYPHIFYTLGLHPHEAKHWVGSREAMKSLFGHALKNKKCVAIGEIGLDYYYNKSTKEEQLEALEEQFALARDWNLPVVIHCRDAFSEVYEMIRRVGISSRGGVMHCFTGGKSEAVEAVDLGLKISFSGILTFKNAVKIQEAAQALPLSEIVLETDCPFLAPVPFRGKPNEPALLPETAKVLAALRKEDIGKIADTTSLNASRLFGI